MRNKIFFLINAIVVLLIIMFLQRNEQKMDKTLVSFLKRNRKTIHEAAVNFNVPVLAVAGVIAAESTLNHNLKDYAEDSLLRIWLQTHNEEWWKKWASEGIKLAKEAESVRLKSNKWPISLIESGYVVSLGPAQITPRALLSACQEDSMKSLPCSGSIKQIISRLLTEKTSIQMVALILNYEANQLKKNSNYDVRADLGLLATLYSMGGEYYRYQFGLNNSIIQYNKFGRWVEEHKDEIKKIIDTQSTKYALP